MKDRHADPAATTVSQAGTRPAGIVRVVAGLWTPAWSCQQPGLLTSALARRAAILAGITTRPGGTP